MYDSVNKVMSIKSNQIKSDAGIGRIVITGTMAPAEYSSHPAPENHDFTVYNMHPLHTNTLLIIEL